MGLVEQVEQWEGEASHGKCTEETSAVLARPTLQVGYQKKECQDTSLAQGTFPGALGCADHPAWIASVLGFLFGLYPSLLGVSFSNRISWASSNFNIYCKLYD